MVRVSALRASDADRELTAEQLRHATAEGRLTAVELEDRLGALYRSKTYGDLDALVADLPVSRLPARTEPVARFPVWAPAAGVLALLTVLLGAVGGGHHDLGSAPLPRDGRAVAPDAGFGGAHHFVTAAASMAAGTILLVALCTGLVWVLMRHRSATRL